MSKIAVVYWSGTGNTEKMAQAAADAASAKGADVDLLTVDAFDTGAVSAYDAIAFGCPAMGAEVLEESEFEPMFAAVEGSLGGKTIGLFGSYGWGDGEWMRSWEDRCRAANAVLVMDGVMANNEPDDEALAACASLGEALA